MEKALQKQDAEHQNTLSKPSPCHPRRDPPRQGHRPVGAVGQEPQGRNQVQGRADRQTLQADRRPEQQETQPVGPVRGPARPDQELPRRQVLPDRQPQGREKCTPVPARRAQAQAPQERPAPGADRASNHSISP